MIGESSLWKFVELVMQHPGCEQIGYLTALDHPVNRSESLGSMAITMAPDLESLLRTFAREITSQSDGAPYRLVTKRRQSWFVRKVKHRIRLAAEEEERGFYAGKAGETWLSDLEKVGTDEH